MKWRKCRTNKLQIDIPWKLIKMLNVPEKLYIAFGIVPIGLRYYYILVLILNSFLNPCGYSGVNELNIAGLCCQKV